MKQHFVTFPPEIGVELLLGCNGYIWITRAIPKEWKDEEERGDNGGEESGAGGAPMAETLQRIRVRHANTPIGPELKENIYRVRNAVEILRTCFRYINGETVRLVYDKSLELGLGINDMLTTENIVKCIQCTRTNKE